MQEAELWSSAELQRMAVVKPLVGEGTRALGIHSQLQLMPRPHVYLRWGVPEDLRAF